MNSKSTLIFIFLTVMIDSTGLGIIIPSMPAIITDITGVSLSEAASYNGWMVMVYALMQFVFAPVLGGLSDAYGRKPVLLSSLLGLGIDYIFLFFAPNLWWLFIGRIISGIFGASFSPAMACIADVSTPDKRVQNFGIIGAAFGIGFVIGPAIGGLLGSFNLRAPFLFAACLSLANFIFGYLAFKETLTVENRRRFDIKRSNFIGSLKQLGKYKTLKWLFLVVFIIGLSDTAVHGSWAFLTKQIFGWNELNVGISLTVVGVSFAIVQGGLAGIISKKFGNKNTIYMALIALIVSLAVIGFAAQGWMLYAVMIPYAVGSMVAPCIKAIASDKTASNEQGELQGAFASIHALAEIAGPPVMAGLYAHYSALAIPFYGAPFIFAVCLIAICFPLVLLAFSTQKSIR
jgi:DHA1 family tetracycline resistance protein-like MFS transporter